MNIEQTASSSIARTTTISGTITGSVAEMIATIAEAAVSMSPAPFVVMYDEDEDVREWIIAVTDQDDPEACIYVDAESRRSSVACSSSTRALNAAWSKYSTSTPMAC